MESVREYERKLGKEIDSLMEEMDRICCADLTEEERIDSKMGDMRFRDELIDHVRRIVQCRKMSQMSKAKGRDTAYTVSIGISADGFGSKVSRG